MSAFALESSSFENAQSPRRRLHAPARWGIDPAAELGEGSAPREGPNDFGTSGYRGPCPPPGHGRHHYVFRLLALDTQLELPAGAAKPDLERAMERHVLTTAELVGTHER
jgi:Raf kinase inhibitor-like YbhB/YbcL family protein